MFFSVPDKFTNIGLPGGKFKMDARGRVKNFETGRIMKAVLFHGKHPGYTLRGSDGKVFNSTARSLYWDTFHVDMPDAVLDALIQAAEGEVFPEWKRQRDRMAARAAEAEAEAVKNCHGLKNAAPEGFTLIPFFPEDKYYINLEGHVYNITEKKYLKPGKQKIAMIFYALKFGDKKIKQISVNTLYKTTFGKPLPHSAHRALYKIATGKDMPARWVYDNVLDDEDVFSRNYPQIEMIPKRKCHDCGALTWDYRCKICQAAWKKKHGVIENAYDADFYDIDDF